MNKKEQAYKWRFEKLLAKMDRLEKKLDYATLKIRGKVEESAPGHMVWKHQPFFVNAQARIKVKGIPDQRCYFLQSCIRSLEHLEGSVAECGVREGKSALFMLEACERDRKFNLFDSFEGLSDPDPTKDTLASSIDATTGERIFSGDIEQVQKNFWGRENVVIHQGWIPEKFEAVKGQKFVFVHVDVDLYQPTYDSINFFYPRMVRGGMLICDDYGSSNYPGARQAMDEYFEDKIETPIELPQGQAFIVKQ